MGLSQYVRPRGTVVCIGLPANAYLKAPVFESVIRVSTNASGALHNHPSSLFHTITQVAFPHNHPSTLFTQSPKWPFHTTTQVAFSLTDTPLHPQMVTIKGSYVGNRKDTSEAIDFFRRGLIKAPYKVVGLSELPKVYELMHEGKIAGRYVVDTSK